MENAARNATKSLYIRFIAFAIFVGGIGLMFLGIFITQHPQLLPTSNSGHFTPHGRELLINTLIVGGGILTFLSGTRLGMSLRPLYLILVGASLAVGAVIGPVVAAQQFPSIRSYNWNQATLMPFFILRMVGIIFFSMGLLRWMVPGRSRIKF